MGYLTRRLYPELFRGYFAIHGFYVIDEYKCVYTHICMYIFTYVYTYYVHILYIHIYIYVYKYIFMYIYKHNNINIYVLCVYGYERGELEVGNGIWGWKDAGLLNRSFLLC